MNTAEMLVKTLHGKRLSPEDRVELLVGLISEKTQMLITRELLMLTHTTKSQVIFQLIAPMFRKNTNKKVLIRI